MQRPTHVRDGAAASWTLSRARWPAAPTSPPVVSNWLGLIYFCVLYNLRRPSASTLPVTSSAHLPRGEETLCIGEYRQTSIVQNSWVRVQVRVVREGMSFP